MTRRLRDERAYDASAQRVLAILTDPASQETLSLASGSVGARATLGEAEGGGIVLTIESARILAGRRVEAVREIAWDRDRKKASWRLVPRDPRARTSARGTVTLVEEGASRCRVIFEAEVSIAVPLAGGALERLVIGMIEREREQEDAWLRARLRGA